MRLRVVASTLLVALTCAGMIALYGASKGPQAVGVGGLPLIKADMSPIKVPPDDTQRDPMNMPNSTIFEALNKGDRVETPKMPTEAAAIAPNLSLEAPAPEFAGFRTGFALPEAPAPKKENLFAPTPDKKTSEPPKEQAKQEATPLGPQVMAAVTPETVTPAKKQTPTKITVPITQAKTEKNTQPDKTVEKPIKSAVKPVEKPADKPVVKTATAAPAKPLPKPPVLAATKPKQKEPTAQALEQEELALMNAPYVPKKPTAQKPVVQKVQAPVVTKAPSQKEKELSARKNDKVVDDTPTKAASIEPSAGSVAQASAAPASHYIQLTSAPTEAAAAKAWSIKSSRYGAALGGLNPIYQRVSINGKDYVRLRAGPFTAVEANRRCAMLKAVDAQGGCLVIRQ